MYLCFRAEERIRFYAIYITYLKTHFAMSSVKNRLWRVRLIDTNAEDCELIAENGKSLNATTFKLRMSDFGWISILQSVQYDFLLRNMKTCVLIIKWSVVRTRASRVAYTCFVNLFYGGLFENLVCTGIWRENSSFLSQSFTFTVLPRKTLSALPLEYTNYW